MLKTPANFRAAIATLFGDSAQTVLAKRMGITPRAIRAWFDRQAIPSHAWTAINEETDNRIAELVNLKQKLKE